MGVTQHGGYNIYLNMLVEWLYRCEKAPALGTEGCTLTWFIATSRGLQGLVPVYTLVFLLQVKLLILLDSFNSFPTFIEFKLRKNGTNRSKEANITIPPNPCSTYHRCKPPTWHQANLAIPFPQKKNPSVNSLQYCGNRGSQQINEEY